MPGAHDEKLIAEKYALDYPRRPLSTRTWKRPWNWAALVLGLILGGGLYFVRGNAAFWSGPVSSSHAAFANDCQKCHTDSWRPALRLVSLDSGRHSVSNIACKECHKVGEHHPRLGETEPLCASCHQEHRGDSALLAIGDRNCTACHIDLNSVPNIELHVAAAIASFDAGTLRHPEFALMRQDVVTQGHGAHQVAAFLDNSWHDTGGILFNHKVHLAADGVLDGNRKKVQLMCADCHEPESDGAYMQPIAYDQHCASCHPLRLADNLAGLGDLPHETPELVRGAIRERAARMQSLELTPTETPIIRRLPAPTSVAGGQADAIDALIAAADHAVFGLEAKGLCRKCHHIEIRDGQWQVANVNPDFANLVGATSRQMVPDRWFAHGNFDHSQHLTVACADCHRVANSTLTSDILLPGIENCRQCHGNVPTKLSQGVVADCTTCHEYHGPTSHGMDALTTNAEAAP